VRDESLRSSEDEASLKRLVFNLATVEWAASIPMKLSPGESVLLLSPDREDGIARSAGTSSGWITGLTRFQCTSCKGLRSGEEGHDIRTDEGACRAVDKIAGLPPLSGMVITFCQGGLGRLRGMADVSRLLRGVFLLLKAFLQSPAKKFVVLIHSRRIPKLRFGC